MPPQIGLRHNATRILLERQPTPMLKLAPAPVPLHRSLRGSERDVVWLDVGAGREVRGAGPFRKSAVAPEKGWAFYVNDFALSDPEPWWVPDRLDFACVSPREAPAALPLSWTPPDRTKFRRVFDDITARLTTGALRKAVPALAERAAWSRELAQRFLHQLPLRPADPGTHSYAFAANDLTLGFAGRTPEVLFRLEDGKLRTMALAGTAPSAESSQLLENPKLVHEHELVVEVLRERLAALGDLTVFPRRLLDLGSMTHLCTKLEVTLNDPAWEQRGEDLIRLLHPTPALGIAPRNVETLTLLDSYRSVLDVPRHFGAPFGVKWPGGMLALVAIRGVFWRNDTAFLPAGCGIVNGSEFESEWAELELKRRWVRRALGVE